MEKIMTQKIEKSLAELLKEIRMSSGAEQEELLNALRDRVSKSKFEEIKNNLRNPSKPIQNSETRSINSEAVVRMKNNKVETETALMVGALILADEATKDPFEIDPFKEMQEGPHPRH
jgi:hypothetical protein